MSLLDGASVLVTGGTGSFGTAFIRHILQEADPRRVVVFSRDELKQSNLRDTIDDPRLRWFLGDVRDAHRLRRAFSEIDFVIHAAALKRVDAAEYNPFEFVQTNVVGSQNVIDAAIDCGVKRVIALSTDKASSPINLYGATKLVADKLFVAANAYGKPRGTSLAVVRYGNVLGSRGSVIPYFRDRLQTGKPLPVTDPEMTRFWISLGDAVGFVLGSLASMQGGETFVPLLPSVRLMDLVQAMSPEHTVEIVGLRPGEKRHEEMISSEDSQRTIKQVGRYIIKPVISEWDTDHWAGEPVPDGFSYRSDTNTNWLASDELRAILTAEKLLP